MKHKTIKMGLYSIVMSVIALAAVIGINLFVNSLPTDKTKYDTTPEDIYSLSEQSIKIAQNIDEPVTIYLLAAETEKDPSLYEFLQRYAAQNDNITIELKDPVLYPNFAKDYTEEDIESNSLVITGEKRGRYVAYSEIYVSETSLNYSTYQYETSTSFDGENCITSALDYVTAEELPVVYQLTGHGEQSLSDYSSQIESSISGENIELTELNLLKEGAVPEDASAVLLFAPETDISEEEFEMLQQYEEQGGKFLVLTDFINEEQTNLKKLLSDFGMEPVDGIVIEADRYYYYQYQSYLLPEFVSHEITDPLSGNYQMLLANAQGVQETEDISDSVAVFPLIQTSDKAYSKIDGTSITTYEKEEGDIDGPLSLAAAAISTIGENTAEMVYIPSVAFLADELNTLVSGANHDFFLNSLEWLCEREETISIRAKSLDVETLSIDEGTALNLEILLMGVIPVALLIFGGIVIYRRRR